MSKPLSMGRDNIQLVLDTAGGPHIFYGGGGTVDAFQLRSGDDWDNFSIYYYSPGVTKEAINVLYGENVVSLSGAAYDLLTDSLHVLWLDGGSLKLSSAPAWKAADAREWTTSTPLALDVIAASLYVDTTGGYHVAYGLRQDGKLEYVFSYDQGLSWSNPVEIDILNSPETAAYTRMKLIGSPDGAIYLTWTVSNLIGGSWGPRSVWQAHLLRADDPSSVISIEEVGKEIPAPSGTKDYLNLNIGPNGDMYRTWNHGAGSNPGRIQQRFVKAQNRWLPPEPILAPESGLAGYNYVFWDSAGAAYQTSNGKKSGDESGENVKRMALYSLRGNQWVLTDYVFQCEVAKLEIFRGNTIHIACPSQNRVFYIRGDIPVAPLPMPTAILLPTPIVTRRHLNTPMPTVSQLPTSTPSPTPIMQPYGELHEGGHPPPMSFGIIAGIVPVMLLVLGVVIFNLRRR